MTAWRSGVIYGFVPSQTELSQVGLAKMGTPVTREHIVSLDALRGIAAIMVVLFHTRIASSVFDFPLVRNGHLFVDFFFVLSGFVISMNYLGKLSDNGNVGVFLVKRIARLWPLHLFTLSIFVLLDAVRLPWSVLNMTATSKTFLSRDYLVELWENVFLLQTFGDSSPNLFNGPNWSISAEFWTYVVFALVVSTFLGKKLAAMSIILLVFCGLVLTGTVEPHFAENSGYGLFKAIYCFVLGCVTQMIYQSKVSRSVISAPVTSFLEIAAVAIAIMGVSMSNLPGSPIVTPVLFCLVILILAIDKGIVAKALSVEPMKILGKISYSIYLNHALILFFTYPILNRLGGLLGRETSHNIQVDGVRTQVFDLGPMWMNNLAVLLVLAAVIASALVTYHSIEMPGQRLFRRALSRPSGKTGHLDKEQQSTQPERK